jgi:hypothetical protein
MLSRPTDDDATADARRFFLARLGGALAAAAVAPGRVLAGPREERLLSFVHVDTGRVRPW